MRFTGGRTANFVESQGAVVDYTSFVTLMCQRREHWRLVRGCLG